MARSLHLYFTKNYPLVLHLTSMPPNTRKFIPSIHTPSLYCFCNLSTQESTHVILLGKLEVALKGHQVDEAWETYKDFKNLYGFPHNAVMSKLITELSYSSNSRLLQKAGDLVISLKGKTDLLRPDLLIKLSLSLARNQMPVPAAIVFRLMLEKSTFLPAPDILSSIFLHMVRTDVGTSLASNILVEVCECIQQFKENKPNTIIFNLVLDGCVRFKLSFKGQQIIELMAKVDVIADGHTINIIAQIHEMNFQRDELKRFKDHIDQVSSSLVCHYRQFYDSLLNLHFKFDDIDSASGLILDIYGKRRELRKNLCFVSIGSENLKTGLKLQISPQLLQKDSVLKVEGKEKLITCKNGKLMLTNKALAMFIIKYKRHGRISELSDLLICVGKQCFCGEIIDNVINACIHMGWLVTAHDILEDFESCGTTLGTRSYTVLLLAYRKSKMFGEAEALLKQINKKGVVLKEETYKKATISKNYLAESLVREMSKEDDKEKSFVINEFNSSIYFFMRAKMVADALNTYRRMQERNILPNVSTFFSLVYGYSSFEMYREITIVWGDIKRNIANGNMVVNRDLYELLALNFVRGGYFERVLEVIECMKEHVMFLDKWMYKREFLKFHKDLYRSLKASKAKDEVQRKRIEDVRAFRKWIGIQ